MSDIEQEMIKASKLRKDEESYGDRQDYLADIVRYFDNACRKNDTLVDKISEQAFAWYEEAAGAINSKEAIPDFPDLEEDDDEGAEAEDIEEDGDRADEAEAETAAAPEEAEAPAAEEPVVEEPAKPKTKKKAAKPKGKKTLKLERNDTGARDKYNLVIGTMRHEVAKFFEKGATQAECKKEFGQTHYNLLKDLQKDGHRVEKTGPGVFKLVHKLETPH